MTDLQAITLARKWAATGVARKIREDMKASRREYAPEIGVAVETLRSWEVGRRRPRGAMGVAYGRLLARHAGLDGS